MAIAFDKESFVAGELTPSIWGNVGYVKFSIGASTMRNCWVSYRGGSYSRAGTSFVGFSKQTGRSVAPRVITFQFSINQGLALEFGNFYMRVVSNGAFVTEPTTAISGITQSSPGVVSDIGHGYSNGDWVALDDILGMTQLNGRTVVVQGITVNSFEIFDVYGNPIDTTGFSPYTGGGTAARIYTLVTPYAEADIYALKFTQSADVMSLTCWNQVSNAQYPTYDLERLADDNWQLNQVTFAASIPPPAEPTLGSVGSAPPSGQPLWTFQYVMTAVSLETGEESIASPPAQIANTANPALQANTIYVTGAPVTGASSYNFYRALPAIDSSGATTYDPSADPVAPGSLYGFVASSQGPSLADSNIVADFSTVPPMHKNPFAQGAVIGGTLTSGGAGYTQYTVGVTINTLTGSGGLLQAQISLGAVIALLVISAGQNYLPTDTITITDSGGGAGATANLIVGPLTGTYPSVVSYFQERRVYAGSPNNPDTYWMTQPGAFTNMDSRIPTVASDAITGTPWAVEVNGIQFMVSMPGGLVVLTGLSAWQLTGVGGSSLNPQPITPANQQAQPQAYNGCSSTIAPVRIDNEIIFVQAKGSILRDLSYNFFVNIYTGVDITQISSQLFTGFTMVQMAWCEEPYKLLWVVRNDGILLSLTFLKAQDVAGWARHDTNGLFVSVCSVTEPPVDALYLATQRFPGGQNAYMIERMDNRFWNGAEDVWAVDVGLQLPQPKPNATLSVSSAVGAGTLTGVTNLIGGQGYSAGTTAVVVDDNGEGPGTGAAPVLTIVGGVITGIAFAPGGSLYTYPAIVITDPANTGSGASARAILDNSAVFSTSVPIFSGANVGSIIRVGGGIAEITQYTDAQHVVANILSPIVATLPNSGGQVLPAPAGNWTMTAPVTTISGLDYLAGATVTGLADGNVIPPTVVSAQGTINLAVPASAVTIGLGFQAQLQSVYLDVGQPTVQGQRKKIAAVTARLENSRGVKMGSNQPDGSTLSPMQIAPKWKNLDAVPDLAPAQYGGIKPPYNSISVPLFTGDRHIPIKGGFQKAGQVALQQDLPLPMQVLALISEIDAGDLPQPAGPVAKQQQPQKRAA